MGGGGRNRERREDRRWMRRRWRLIETGARGWKKRKGDAPQGSRVTNEKRV